MYLLNKKPETDTKGERLQNCNAYVDSVAQAVTLNALTYFPDTIIEKLLTVLEPSSPMSGDGGFFVF